jgi:hypothetical protein
VSVKAPILYVGSDELSAANRFDIAYLRHSPSHDLVGVCQSKDEIESHLSKQDEPVNLVLTEEHESVRALIDLIAQDKAYFRERVSRVFVVGGQVNDYANGILRVPIDPRLQEQHPERFAPELGNCALLGKLLTSGEAIIWLPSDICLWRYAAPQLLEESHLAEVHAALGHLADEVGNDYAPVLLSTFPAFFLAYQPDITLWLRLFRTIPVQLACDTQGAITRWDTGSQHPNLYVVVAIDGTALTKQITPTLRGTLQ